MTCLPSGALPSSPTLRVDELPALLTVEELAALARIGRSAAYEAVRRGDVRSVRLGRTIRVPRRAVLELLGEETS